MAVITNILFPVDFSHSCVAMASYVKRAARIFGANVTLIHVFDPWSANGFELYVRRLEEVILEHRDIARQRLDAFLEAEFPVSQHPRLLAAGEAATVIAETARTGFDLIIMPTHAGRFRQMLLGSTTAKVLNDADCPVMTSHHAETIAPRPIEHRELLCAVGLEEDSERVLRYANRISRAAGGRLSVVHAIQDNTSGLPLQLDLEEQVQSVVSREAFERIEELQRRAGTQAPVRVVTGTIKKALLQAVRESDADGLVLGRSPLPGTHGRIRDLTYAMIRDSPIPVWSV